MLGWLGIMMLSLSVLPQTVKTIKIKSSNDFSFLFLFLWLFGLLFSFIAVIVEFGFVPWLLCGYTLNAILLLPIIYYKVYNE